jgi:hypothetical protein
MEHERKPVNRTARQFLRALEKQYVIYPKAVHGYLMKLGRKAVKT